MSLGCRPSGDIVLNPVVSCCYFLPGHQLPSSSRGASPPFCQCHMCEQLSPSHYVKAEQPEVEL